MKFKFDILYLAMACTIIGQCLVGNSFFIGQGLFLGANATYLIRDFFLGRPKADKIKNTAFTAITFGLILMRLVQ